MENSRFRGLSVLFQAGGATAWLHPHIKGDEHEQFTGYSTKPVNSSETLSDVTKQETTRKEKLFTRCPNRGMTRLVFWLYCLYLFLWEACGVSRLTAGSGAPR